MSQEDCDPSSCPSVFVKCRKVRHTLGYTITNSQSSSVSCVLVSHMYKVSAVSLAVPQSHRSRMSTTVLLLMKDNVSFQKLLFLGNEGTSQLHSLFRVHKRRSQMANGQKFKRQTRFVQFCSCGSIKRGILSQKVAFWTAYLNADCSHWFPVTHILLLKKKPLAGKPSIRKCQKAVDIFRNPLSPTTSAYIKGDFF